MIEIECVSALDRMPSQIRSEFLAWLSSLEALKLPTFPPADELTVQVGRSDRDASAQWLVRARTGKGRRWVSATTDVYPPESTWRYWGNGA